MGERGEHSSTPSDPRYWKSPQRFAHFVKNLKREESTERKKNTHTHVSPDNSNNKKIDGNNQKRKLGGGGKGKGTAEWEQRAQPFHAISRADNKNYGKIWARGGGAAFWHQSIMTMIASIVTSVSLSVCLSPPDPGLSCQ